MSPADQREIAVFLRRTAEAYERAAAGTPSAADIEQTRLFRDWVASSTTERHQ